MAFDKLNLAPKGFDAQKIAASLTAGASLETAAQGNAKQAQATLFSQLLQPDTSSTPVQPKPQASSPQAPKDNEIAQSVTPKSQVPQWSEPASSSQASDPVTDSASPKADLNSAQASEDEAAAKTIAALPADAETDIATSVLVSPQPMTTASISAEAMAVALNAANTNAQVTPVATTDATTLTTVVTEAMPQAKGMKLATGKVSGGAVSEAVSPEAGTTASPKMAATKGSDPFSELALATGDAATEAGTSQKDLAATAKMPTEAVTNSFGANNFVAGAKLDQALTPTSVPVVADNASSPASMPSAAVTGTPSPATPETPAPAPAAYALSQASAESISQLGMQLQKRLSQGTTQFNIELYPADMGRVDVSLQIGKDGKIAAQLVFDSSLSASSFSASEKELRQHLADTGLQIADEGITITARAPEAAKTDSAGADKPFMAASRQESSKDVAKNEASIGQNLDRQNQERQQQQQAHGGTKTSALDIFARQNQTADALSAQALVRAGYTTGSTHLALNLIV